ncbi:hypothetical protein WME91_54110 [Sorangium sp. So ce269]
MGDSTLPRYHNPPTPVKGVQGAAALAAGLSHTCALLASGGVTCWGWNRGGLLGGGAPEETGPPTRVKGLDDAKQVALGNAQSCALRQSGALFCWGGARWPNIQGATLLAAGSGHLCAMLSSGQVACWGDNMSGQVGTDAQGRIDSPVVVSGLPARPRPHGQRVHPYIVACRAELLRALGSDPAASDLRAIDATGTLDGDERALTLLAADQSARVSFPLLVRALRKASPSVLPGTAEEVAREMESLRPITGRHEAEAARRLMYRLNPALLEAHEKLSMSGTPEDMLVNAGLTAAARVLERAALLLGEKGPDGDLEIVRDAVTIVEAAAALEQKPGPAAAAGAQLLRRMVDRARLQRKVHQAPRDVR